MLRLNFALSTTERPGLSLPPTRPFRPTWTSTSSTTMWPSSVPTEHRARPELQPEQGAGVLDLREEEIQIHLERDPPKWAPLEEVTWILQCV